jgi:multiple sugar transport system permease protein
VNRAGLFLAVAVVAAWSLAPAAWQALTALKPDDQITRVPTVYLPDPPTSRHFETLWTRKPFGAYLLNSLIVSGTAALLAVTVGLMAAGALARTSGPLRDRTLLGLLLLYEGVRALGWVNHRIGLILPYAALNLPLAVWILESGFRQIPREVDEAARLDGLSPLGRVFRVQLPLAAPTVVTAGILVFIFCWNEFMLALTFMTRDAGKTVTAGIASVGGASIYEIPWGQLSAAIVLATLPLVLLVLVFQRRIASGLTRGAVKG